MRLAFVGALAVGGGALSACQLILPFNESSGDGGSSVEGGGPDVVADAPGDHGGSTTDGTTDGMADASVDSGAPKDAATDTIVDAGCGPNGNDPHNCGACGHDCQGGACDAGACQPVVLASDQTTPEAVSLYAGRVYWSTYDDNPKSGVWSVAVDGGTEAGLLAQDDYLLGITASAGGVYWASTNGVATYVDGGPEVFVPGTDPQALISNDAGIYWSSWGSPKPIYEEPYGPPVAEAGTPLYLAASTAFGLALFGGNLFWTTNNSGAGTGTVTFGSVNGGQTTTIAANEDNPNGISVDSTGVYWETYGVQGGVGGAPDEAILAAGLDGGSVVTLASGESHPYAVWADPNDAYVYWVDQGTPGNVYTDGSVRRIRKDGTSGGVPTTLATDQQDPVGIVGDGTCIYWLNLGPTNSSGYSTTGQVLKLAKPPE
jgi:hypothetical protein